MLPVPSRKFAATKTSVEIADPVAEKAKEKADAEAEATRKAMADRGKALAESMRTPIEIYRDTVAELNEMVNAGTISWEIYNRGVKKALESLVVSSQGGGGLQHAGYRCRHSQQC